MPTPSNSSDVRERSLVRTQLVTTKPWGREVLWARTPEYAAKMLHIDEGHALSMQYHREKRETLYVAQGTVSVESRIVGTDVLETWRDLFFEGQAFHVEPLTIHRIASVNGPAVLVEVSTPELDDVVRLLDDYGRAAVRGGTNQDAT